MKDINLYINNQEIEFSISPDILFTYQQDDLTNPTIVKNNFSKTVMVKGTPKNNKIFGEIWNVERIQGSDNYNASKRVPFSLYVNGDLYTTGYAKLDKVNMVNNDINYSITLYGGLGSFLYNLSYDWNTGDKKTLKDLKFYTGSTSNTEIDFDFDFTKDTVNSAWTWSNMSSTSSKWYHINFAPTYNGVPENFSADKVLINFNDLPVGTSGTTSAGTAYTTYNGYALGTLPKGMTQEETRDFRAYLQTPVVRVKSIFDAICRKENNQGLYDKGFDVELDGDFFTPSNPYYWDSWMTLPMINNLEISKTGTGSSTAYTGTSYFYSSADRGATMVFPLVSPVTEGNMSVKIGFKVACAVGSATTTSSTLEIASYLDINAIGVQGYASNSLSSGGNALSGSRIKWLSHPSYRNGVKLTCENAIRSNTYSPMWNNYADYIEGKFNKLSNGLYVWDSVLELEFDLPIGATCFKLDFYPVNISNQSRRYILFDFENNDGRIYDRTYTFSSTYTWPARDIQAYIYGSDNTQYNTIRRVTKDLLLDTSYSPADWLLSYIKMFGLYIYKDEIEDKIYIKTRNNFYDRDVNHIVDIEHLIDRGNSADLNPIFCQYAHLELKNDTEESRPEKDYETKYNKTFGEKIVNTGYEFNADTKNVFEKNILKGAVQSKEVSDLFYKPDSGVHPYYWNNISYNLYEDGNPTGSTYEIKPGTRDIQVAFQPYDEEYPGYDFIGKPMFADGENKPLDTSNVMLFFNGYKDVSGYNWILSDDVSEMFTLNNNPCWLMSVSTANTNGVEICKKISDFPRFSRMFEGNNWMIYSWDFGSPREMYIPSMVDNPEGNIYYNYFKDFYTDLYDVDTRVLTCSIKPGLKFSNEDLRRIYWFRNKYWRLNKITDYNPTNYNTTKSEFISVSDVNSLSNYNATSDVTVKVYLEKYCVGSESTTIIGTVKTSDNGSWTIESVSVSSPSGTVVQDVTVSPDAGGSSGTFSLILPDNPNYDRVITINVTAGDTGASTKCTQAGAYSTFYCPEDELIYETSGGIYTITMTNPANLETIVISKPDWIRVNPRTENSGTTLSIIASENHTAEERNGEVIIKDVYHNVTYTIPINQKCHTITSIAFNSLDWVVDVPSSGGTADKDNCLYQVLGFYSDGGFIDVTSSVTITGSIVVTANTSTNRLDIGNLVLTASLGTLTAERTVKAYQAGKVLISVGFSEITSTKDVCYLGGYVDESYCSGYTVIAYWDNLINEDITSIVDVTFTGFSVEETRNPERAYVGDLVLSVYYLGKTAIGVLPIYQEAYVDYFRVNVLTGGSISFFDTYQYSIGKTYEYRLNCNDWNTASTLDSSAITVNSGDVVLFRGNGLKSYYASTDIRFKTNYNTLVNIEGNVLSLGYYDNFESITDVTSSSDEKFDCRCLFEDSRVRSAKDLKLTPSLVINQYYGAMFKNCTLLVEAPELPTLTYTRQHPDADFVFYEMFKGCTSLIKAPSKIVIKNIDGAFASWNSLCRNMFEGCTSLEIPPAVYYEGNPYGWETEYSYMSMFEGCTSLLISPELYTGDILHLYDRMFYGCSNLEYIRALFIPDTEEYLSTRDWVEGVSGGGVFAKNHSVPASSWTSTYWWNACPSGWTIEDYTEGVDLVFVKAKCDEDVSYTGGTVTKDDCSYRIILVNRYEIKEVTDDAIVSGNTLIVPETTASTRELVGQITLTATYSGFSGSTTIDVYQERDYIEDCLLVSGLTWVTDVPASGGTATKDNCSYTIIEYKNNVPYDVTDYSTVVGSLIVPTTTATTKQSVGTLTLTASYDGMSGSSSVTAWQAAPSITGIGFSTLSWVTDVPAIGGTATKDNCSYTILAYYNVGLTYDITDYSTVVGSLIVPPTTATTRQSAGTLTLTATTTFHGDFSASSNVTVYQEAFDPKYEYFTFNIITGGTIKLKCSTNSTQKTIKYSKDNGVTWNNLTSTTSGAYFNVNEGDVVRFKGDNATYSNGSYINTFSGSSAYFSIEGNIMSLVDSEGFATATTLTSGGTFIGLFKGCYRLTSAEKLILPATSLTENCYSNMFSGCTQLTSVPELPAETLESGSYAYLFCDCPNVNNVKCLATDVSANGATMYWLDGASSSGTFVKNPNMSSWTRDTSGIPSGWTVVDAT